ncbi:MAG TPA: hypothetical protein VF056_05720 [Thermoleophilaceae bacterium]
MRIVLHAAQFEPLPPERIRSVNFVVHVEGDSTRGPECARAHVCRGRRVVDRRVFEPLCGIVILRPIQPEPPKGRPETERAFAAAVLDQPCERSAKARQLPLKAEERRGAQLTHSRMPLARVELLRDAEEVVVVATTERRRIRQVAQLLERELLDGREHEEAPVLAVPEQALIHQRLQDVELGGTDGFGRLEREAPGEHRELCKQPLFVSREELVAPLDGPAQRALALGRVMRAGRQQVEATTEALEDLPRCEHLDASGSKLERERKAVEPLCDLTHRRVRLEAGLQLARALREQNTSVIDRERRHRKLLFSGNIQAAAARGEDARVEPNNDVGGAWEQLLEIVEHEQGALAREELVQVVGTTDHPRDRRLDQLRIPYRGERDEPDAVAVPLDALGSRLQREASLARAAWASERDDAMRVEQREHLRKLAVAADERRRLHRQVCLVDSLQRRELILAELVEALGRGKVLEPMHAKVAQAIRAEEIARCLREKNLTAVTCGGNPRGAMYIDPDVVFTGHSRLARMQTHAHSDRPVAQRIARSCRRRQQARRALDVSEQERDGALRERHV